MPDTLTDMMPKGRCEAFSDGVIAIVITLLVFGIHVPTLPRDAKSSEVIHLLLPLVSGLVAFAVSFVICAVWWISHHNFLHDLTHIDKPLLWLNCLFLFWLALLPIPTGLLGQAYKQPLISCIYAANCALTGLSFLFMRIYASGSSRLLRAEISPGEARRRVTRSALSPVLYSVAALIAFFNPLISAGLFIGIPAYFAFAGLNGAAQASDLPKVFRPRSKRQ